MTVPVLARVTMEAFTGLPVDRPSNDWAFLAADTTDSTLNGIASSLTDFYANASTGIGGFLGPQISRAVDGSQVAFYDLTGHLDGSPTGSPIHVVPFTPGNENSGARSFPAEVSIVLSFEASGWASVPEKSVNPTPPPAFHRPRARYRGRVYLGPVDSATADGAYEPTPTSSSWMSTIAAAVTKFQDERADWGVWSRADATIRLLAPSGRVWQDNAYDTQRRRGRKATGRTVLFP
jgi:hypothetical protein